MARVGRRGNGEGHIGSKPDKNGLWRGYVSLGWGPDGKEHRKWIYGHTRREVAEDLKVLLRDQQQGIEIAPGRVVVGRFLWDWLTNVKKRSIAPATYVSYEVIVRVHLEPGLGRHPLHALSPEHIDEYITYKLGQGMSARSVQYQVALLRSALKTAMKRGLVVRNVAELVEMPRIESREMRALTLEQARSFLRSIRGHRLEALYVTLLTLGLRRGEVLALRWEDVDLEHVRLTVRAGLQRLSGKLERTGVKTRRSRRTLALPRSVAALLRARRAIQAQEKLRAGPTWKDGDCDYVFTSRLGTPIEPRNLNRQFSSLLKRAGLPQFRVHDARHSAATFMRAADVPVETVSRRLGHSRVSTTVDIYVHPEEAEDRAAAERVDELFGLQG